MGLDDGKTNRDTGKKKGKGNQNPTLSTTAKMTTR